MFVVNPKVILVGIGVMLCLGIGRNARVQSGIFSQSLGMVIGTRIGKAWGGGADGSSI